MISTQFLLLLQHMYNFSTHLMAPRAKSSEIGVIIHQKVIGKVSLSSEAAFLYNMYSIR